MQDPAVNKIIYKEGFDYTDLYEEEAEAILNITKNISFSTGYAEKDERHLLYLVKLLLQDFKPDYKKAILKILSNKSFPIYYRYKKIETYINNYDLTNTLHYNHCLCWLRTQLKSNVTLTFIDNKGKKLSETEINR
ncbi:MAG: hypothetical protein ACOCP8_09360, partial [archaeon]